MDDDNDDDEYTIPLKDQRVFGAGIKRKRIAFVPAADSSAEVGGLPAPTSSSSSSSSAADRYLSIVLPNKGTGVSIAPADCGTEKTSLCTVCRQPVLAAATDAEAAAAVNTHHETSIAHQVCLQHSKPPSHLDRRHVGVKYLAAYGWDPDDGYGLGAQGEGIRVPIKAAREKNDTVGLRERGDDGEEDDNPEKRTKTKKREWQNREKAGAIVRLNAKEVRKKELAAKKRAEALRTAFYSDVDVDKYLGSAK